MPVGQLIYREEQRFAGWTYVLVAVAALAAPVVMWKQGLHGEGYGAFIALVATVLFFLLRLEIEVRTSGVYVRFFPFPWKRIDLSHCVRIRSVTYRPLAEYGGWGVRHVLGGRAYSARGDRGVRLDFADGRHTLLGSQHPEALAEAISSLAETHGLSLATG